MAPVVFNSLQNYKVTGRICLFAGATGPCTGSETICLISGLPLGKRSFRGLLEIAATPEPTSWAMLNTGFGIVGG